MTDPRTPQPPRPSGRVCVTRGWKRRRAPTRPASSAGVGTSTDPRALGPLFNGRVFLADLTFTDGSGTSHAVARADLATVLRYLSLAAPLISRYAGQYGPNRVDVSNVPLALAVSLGGTSYSDADLQRWVNELAGSIPSGEPGAVIVLNPPGLTNSDAKESGGVGVLGYHGTANVPYAFVNLLGSGFTLDDLSDLYAEALSHEIAEMVVDPAANDANPEVCDGCGTNCQGTGAHRAYFNQAGGYLGSATTFPPAFPYTFFLSSIATPAVAADCPAPASGCDYAPP